MRYALRRAHLFEIEPNPKKNKKALRKNPTVVGLYIETVKVTESKRRMRLARSKQNPLNSDGWRRIVMRSVRADPGRRIGPESASAACPCAHRPGRP
jgi:hypothetical protein